MSGYPTNYGSMLIKVLQWPWDMGTIILDEKEFFTNPKQEQWIPVGT
jgi:hypothetical protein